MGIQARRQGWDFKEGQTLSLFPPAKMMKELCWPLTRSPFRHDVPYHITENVDFTGINLVTVSFSSTRIISSRKTGI